MAKNATQANNVKGSKVDQTAKAIIGAALVGVTPEHMSENVAAKFGTALEHFGKDTMEKAALAARSALSDVRGVEKEVTELEGIIQTKREGNAGVLLRLASDCVKLTMKGNRAQLGEAAELMRVACSFAEDELVTSDAKEHNGVQRKIAQIVPSWPVLKGDMINAMKKAHLNPIKFEGQPTKIRDAYKEFLKSPSGQQTKSSRGRQEEPTSTTKVDVPTRVADAAKKINKLTDSCRSVINHLLQVLQTKDEESQNKCAAELESFIKLTLEPMEADEEADSETTGSPRGRARPNPARESDRPNA